MKNFTHNTNTEEKPNCTSKWRSCISVLVVGSQPPALQQTIKTMEAQKSLASSSVSSVRDALEQLKLQVHDVVVCRDALADKTGLELLKLLRENGDNTSFILIATTRNDDEELEALRLGAERYINVADRPQMGSAELHHALLNIIKKKNTLIKLRTSEEKFNALIDSAKDGIAIIDDTGKIVHWNCACETIFGYTREEVLGKTIHFLMPSERVPSFVEASQKISANFKETGGAFSTDTVQMPGIRKDGTLVQTEMAMSFLSLENKWLGLAIIRDITERLKAEKELLLQTERLRATYASSPDAIINIDIEGKIVDCNEEALRTFLYPSKESMIGMSSLELVAEAERKKAATDLHEVVANNKIVRNEEFVGLKSSGEEFRITASVSPLKEEKGNLVGIIASIKDVTAQKKAEEKIRLLSSVVQQALEGIAVSDPQGRILFVNSAWLKMHDFNENDTEVLIGQWIMRFYSTEQIETIATKFQPRNTFRGRITQVKKDGTTFPALGTLSPLRNADGQIIGVIHMAKPLTEIVRDIRDAKSVPSFTFKKEENVTYT